MFNFGSKKRESSEAGNWLVFYGLVTIQPLLLWKQASYPIWKPILTLPNACWNSTSSNPSWKTSLSAQNLAGGYSGFPCCFGKHVCGEKTSPTPFFCVRACDCWDIQEGSTAIGLRQGLGVIPRQPLKGILDDFLGMAL